MFYCKVPGSFCLSITEVSLKAKTSRTYKDRSGSLPHLEMLGVLPPQWHLSHYCPYSQLMLTLLANLSSGPGTASSFLPQDLHLLLAELSPSSVRVTKWSLSMRQSSLPQAGVPAQISQSHFLLSGSVCPPPTPPHPNVWETSPAQALETAGCQG